MRSKEIYKIKFNEEESIKEIELLGNDGDLYQKYRKAYQSIMIPLEDFIMFYGSSNGKTLNALWFPLPIPVMFLPGAQNKNETCGTKYIEAFYSKMME